MTGSHPLTLSYRIASPDAVEAVGDAVAATVAEATPVKDGATVGAVSLLQAASMSTLPTANKILNLCTVIPST
jgi:hypothetical protein